MYFPQFCVTPKYLLVTSQPFFEVDGLNFIVSVICLSYPLKIMLNNLFI